MSNVLIGIIGVILFIGLALAGALFLGPRFQESTNSSRASAAVQAVSQVANASVMKTIQEGSPVMAGTSVSDLVGGGFLKSEPGNPTGSEAMQIFGALGEGGAANVKAGMVVMRMVGNAESVCSAISKQTSGSGYATVNDAGQFPSGQAGCFRTGSSSVFSLTANNFYAFARI